MAPLLAGLGFACRIHDNPAGADLPILVARRIEDPALPTVLLYGHGDVVRGNAARWDAGRDPWTLRVEGDRWYGRGTADNKASTASAWPRCARPSPRAAAGWASTPSG